MLPSRLVVLAATLAATASAQPGGLYLVGAADRTSFDEGFVTAFAESYSDYYAARIAEPLAPFEANPVGMTAGGIFRLAVGPMAMGLGYTYTSRPGYDETADLSGIRQRFTLDTWDHTGWFETTVNAGPAFVGGFMTALVRGQRASARTIYADGSESLGTEYGLNGTYTGFTTGNELGVMGGIAIGSRIVIPVRYVVHTITYYGARQDNPIADDDVRELNSAFPVDFERYLLDQNGLDFGNALSGDDFLGPRLLVGIELRIL